MPQTFDLEALVVEDQSAYFTVDSLDDYFCDEALPDVKDRSWNVARIKDSSARIDNHTAR